MAYFGPGPAPDGLEVVERSDEACFVCSIRLKDGDHGVVLPHDGILGESHRNAHLECWRMLLRSET